MAKVASMAWVEAARPTARQTGAEPVHVHYLTEANLRAIEAILATPTAENTIVNPLIVRDIVRKGRKAIAEIAGARERKREIRVVTGMRDPVARSLSLLSFFADFCGHTSAALSARDKATPDAVCAVLYELWRSVLAGAEPEASFERLVWRMMGSYRTWFSDELAAAFEIDIFSTPFPAAGGAQRLSGPGVEMIAYRAEDMVPGALSHEALLDEARRFLSAPDLALPQFNTAATRRSYPLYAQTRDRFRLPAAMLDEIYAAPAVTHFYSPSEIAKLKACWVEPPGLEMR